ncbi:hypothetical protein JCM19232_2073 [Vibrio ishigakensis]|uniref:Uncharacterized protein n=1 Tax=Vibrio ishigakensis TaxID=1481914 RepID=A0A0B8PQ00_9VIBR|nr:hypothetical protein JCM19232_2073 [Vibrio ishigakensis]GAM78338.1 hypothetical protein JCM19241_6169 [Vibrio ishigakensis]
MGLVHWGFPSKVFENKITLKHKAPIWQRVESDLGVQANTF